MLVPWPRFLGSGLCIINPGENYDVSPQYLLQSYNSCPCDLNKSGQLVTSWLYQMPTCSTYTHVKIKGAKVRHQNDITRTTYRDPHDPELMSDIKMISQELLIVITMILNQCRIHMRLYYWPCLVIHPEDRQPYYFWIHPPSSFHTGYSWSSIQFKKKKISINIGNMENHFTKNCSPGGNNQFFLNIWHFFKYLHTYNWKYWKSFHWKLFTGS